MSTSKEQTTMAKKNKKLWPTLLTIYLAGAFCMYGYSYNWVVDVHQFVHKEAIGFAFLVAYVWPLVVALIILYNIGKLSIWVMS